MLQHLNSPEKKIWTAEDPVEITQPGLQQLQVQPGIGLDFLAALRAFVRADPDVIMIGEIRDRETAQIAIEASLTGHLVLSTLHTNSAPETLVRLWDFGVDPVSISEAILGIAAQRLVRTLCSKCKKPYRPSAPELTTLRHSYGKEYFEELNIDPKELELYKRVGCQNCNGTGYRGRVAIHELLIPDAAMKKQIYDRAAIDQLQQAAIRAGTRTLIQDGIRKVIEGQTDLAEVGRVTMLSL